MAASPRTPRDRIRPYVVCVITSIAIGCLATTFVLFQPKRSLRLRTDNPASGPTSERVHNIETFPETQQTPIQSLTIDSQKEEDFELYESLNPHNDHWSRSARSKRQVACSSWTNWVSKCAPCGGCGRRVRRCRDNKNIREYDRCPAKICLRGRHSLREVAISPIGRYISRARTCCYDFRPKTPKLLPFRRRCTARRSGGFAYPDPCETDPCLNSGTCVRQGRTARYRCECPSGYIGTHCETEFNFCDLNLCQNGSCDRGIQKCRCPTLHSGQFCEIVNQP